MDSSKAVDGHARIPTMVSQAFWCDPANKFSFDKALMPTLFEGADDLCWLDQLLEGGIMVPQSGGAARAVTILLTGRPGTGKSILASEICYRRALQGARSLYITVEAHEPWLIRNAESLGWDPAYFHDRPPPGK